MSTSLAAQLRQLAVPSTDIFKDEKKRPTLLFDPKEAASISGDVIFEIGNEGLQQLIGRDEKFSQFLENLFHTSSKDFDRNMHSREENKKIDKTIKKFFVMTSPYFLTNAAHKALEWLYFRYRINEFNKIELITMALPYYTTNIFTRLIQTCKFDQVTDPYYFLSAMKKSNTHLDRLTFFRHVHSNGKIVKCITKFLLQLMDIHKNEILTVHFNFYCTAFCGAIDVAPKVEDPFVTEILPLILEGLGSPVPDFASASFVITARLLSKIQLSGKLLSVFVEKISQLKCKSVEMEATLLLVLIYQLQDCYTQLSEVALRNLVQSSWAIECVAYLHSNGNCVYPFLKVIVEQVVVQGGANNGQLLYRTFLEKIVENIEFDSYFLAEFMSITLDKINKEVLNDPEVISWLQNIFNKLQIKYFDSDKFSDSVKKVLEHENSEHRGHIFTKLKLNRLETKTKQQQFNWKELMVNHQSFEEKLAILMKTAVKIVGKSVVPIPRTEEIENMKKKLSNGFKELKSLYSKDYDEQKSLLEPLVIVDYCNVNQTMEEVYNISAAGLLNEKHLRKLLLEVQQTLTMSQCFKLNTLSAGINLLILLMHENVHIRESALEIISYFLKVNNKDLKELNHMWFLKKLLHYKEEILADNEQVALVAVKILTSTKGQRFQSDLVDLMCKEDLPLHASYGALRLTAHVSNFELVEQLCQHFQKLFTDKPKFSDLEGKILISLVERIHQDIMHKITLTSFTWQFILFAINKPSIIKSTLEESVTLPTIVLRQFCRDAYHLLQEEVVRELLEYICTLSAATEDPEFLALSSKIFKHIDLDVKLVTKILKDMSEIKSQKPVTSKSKRRVQAPTVDLLDTPTWKKGVCLLEFIQNKKKMRNGHLLLPILFEILKKCLDFEEQAVVEYPKQLTLSLVLVICSKLEDEAVSEKDFNIELVIQCIRASQNPQTHYHALLVLAHAAKVVPNEVLHHVMAVFTFVGSTLVRHDDAYSFEIISKILDTIVPILVKQRERQDCESTSIADVLRVFADAILDVPEHRRMSLYTQLLNHVNVKENLYLFLLFVLEAEVMHPPREKKKVDKGTPSQRLQIALQLSGEFSVDVILHTCTLLTKYLNELPEEKEDYLRTPQVLIDLKNYTAKQFRHFKYLIITFLASLLSSKPLVTKVSLITAKENIRVEGLYKEIIVNVLSYIQRTQKVCDSTINSPQALYWKTVLYHSYDLLDNVNDLLSPRMFLLVIKGLLVHSMITVKKRALELLNTKLQSGFPELRKEDEAEMYVLIKPILLIISPAGERDDLPSDQETLVQTALLSVKLIVKTLGSNDPEQFIQVLNFVAGILHSGNVQGNVLASVILCLAELCTVLRGHALQSLTSFMSAFLTVLKKQKLQDTCSMLLLSVVTAVNKLLDSFAAFLSPYLVKLICECSVLMSKWSSSSEDPKCQPLISRLNGIKKKLATLIPVRVLLPTVNQCYDILVAKKYYNGIVALISIVEEQISGLSSSEVALNMSELTNFFLKTLEFRCKENPALEVANFVESQVVKSVTVFTLKLSESTFRPFYFQLYDWAVKSNGNHERLITFYHLSETIGHSLKGLFVLFAGNVLSNASDILRSIDSQEGALPSSDKTVLLLEYVLKTLKVIFTYDSKKLLNRDRFELLMQPMVDLLEKPIDGIEVLVRRNEELITPTIVQFAVAVADDGLWKEMNYQILLKMRNSSPEIRLVALHCLAELVAKLREDFMPLLPETIPFLAELLEDEDERVEKSCQRAVREMEKVLGEPLQKYF